MRRMTATVIVMAILMGLLPGVAWAGDDEGKDSAAEQAFRAAWWKETSEGRLDEAAQLYEQAAAAEGPAGIKARALYRLGVVLERMGKTEEAIQTLERLAKAHFGQEELLTKAKARLEEWTAVDLRTNFDEWYRRYQYSPEFQARIVELVLSLSPAADSDATRTATDELLTIGEPAIAALEAHTASSNPSLRDRVVDILMRLGRIPGAESLATTSRWSRTEANWRLLLEAPPATKAELLEVLRAREGTDTLQSVLGPREGWIDAVKQNPKPALLRAVLAQGLDETMAGRIKSLVGEGSGLGADIVVALQRAGYVSDVDYTVWLKGRSSYGVVHHVARVLLDREELPRGMLRTVIDRMRVEPARSPVQTPLYDLLVSGIDEDAGAETLKAAARATEHAYTGNYIRVPRRRDLHPTPPARFTRENEARLLAAVIDHSTDPKLVKAAMNGWADLRKDDPQASLRMLSWADAPLDPENRARAALYAGSMASAETIDTVLKGLPSMEPALAAEVWRGLEGHRTLQGLPWGDKRLLELLALSKKVGTTPPTRQTGTRGKRGATRQDRFMKRLFGTQHRVEQVARLFLKVPWRIPVDVVRMIPSELRNSRSVVSKVREGFPTTWHDVPLRGKQAMLDVGPWLWGGLEGRGDLTPFLRSQARAVWGVQSDPRDAARQKAVKRRLLELLPTIDLDDVKAVYDLEDPAQAAAAASLDELPKTPEVYDALAAARNADEDGRWTHWEVFKKVREPLEFRRRIFRDMAIDADEHWRAIAIEALGAMRNGKDLDLLRRALKDEMPAIRKSAAEAMARVYDKPSIKALVHALDDDHPDVRDAVLKTLDAIKEVEQKKQYWRDNVRSDGRMPSGD